MCSRMNDKIATAKQYYTYTCSDVRAHNMKNIQKNVGKMDTKIQQTLATLHEQFVEFSKKCGGINNEGNGKKNNMTTSVVDNNNNDNNNIVSTTDSNNNNNNVKNSLSSPEKKKLMERVRLK